MSENKNLDGIKKLSKAEVKKARKILLDYIGEDAEKSNSEKKEKPENNKSVDGILSGLNFKKRAKREEKARKEKANTEEEKKIFRNELGFSNKQTKAEKVDKNVSESLLKMTEKNPKIVEKNREREHGQIKKSRIIKTEEEHSLSLKKEINDKRKTILEEKKRKEKISLETNRIKDELEKEKKHLEKIKKEDLERKKRKKEEKEIEEKAKSKKAKKERKKRIRKKIKFFKHLIHKRSVDILLIIKNMRKKIAVSILLLFAISLLLYLFFILFIIKIKPDNTISRTLANFMPVPALVSLGGVVQYYEYVDQKIILKSKFGLEKSSDVNKVFALDFVFNSLMKKYKINSNDKDFKQKVEKSVLLDLDINNVGLLRIKKIKDLISNGENFVQVAEKYGDTVDKIDFKNEKDALDKYGSQLSGLKLDEISDVVIHDDGYYIFKRYKKNNTFSLSYVYIASVNLDNYLNEEAGRLKIWTLVD